MDSYQITFDTYNKVALAYQEKFMGMDLYDHTYDHFCDLIRIPRATIFEIGCGPGNVTRYLLDKRPDFHIDGIDMAPNMIALAQKNNPEARFRMMDCRNIDSIEAKYHGIMCGFCLPYLSNNDCEKLIYDSALLLNQGGVLYISAIEDDYSKSGYETAASGHTIYIFYHQSAHLLEMLQSNGFVTEVPQRITYRKNDGTHETHIILIGIKN